MTKAHPHADLMMQYAQDAAETDRPWERWEFLDETHSDEWCSCGSHPGWRTLFAYRRKPQIITVNGFEVPAPVKGVLPGDVVWLASPAAQPFALMFEYSGTVLSIPLERGLLHTTKEAAAAHAKAMLGIDPKGD